MTIAISDFEKLEIHTENSPDRRDNMLYMPKIFGWWLAILTASIMVVSAGCSGNYGKRQYGNEVGQAFREFEMIEGYRYYYSGRQSLPTAIVGIDPAFEFGSKFWTAIEPNEFQTMVNRLSPPVTGLLSGAYLITPDGRRAGVWYSWVNTVSVRVEGKRIIISFPDPSVRRWG